MVQQKEVRPHLARGGPSTSKSKRDKTITADTEQLQSSLVRNLKKKERKEYRLPEYDYGIHRRGGSKKTSNAQGKRPNKEACKAGGLLIVDIEDLPPDTPTHVVSSLKFSLKGPVAKMLELKDRNQLDLIFKCDRMDAIVWSSNQNQVSMADIMRLLQELDITSSVIDAYSEMIYEEQKDKPVPADEKGPKSFFFTSICMSLINADRLALKEHMFDNLILDAYANHTYLHFPINTNNNHWTLLVFDNEEGGWRFYNSLRPRTANRKDTLIKDAIKMKKYFESFLQKHHTSNLRRQGVVTMQDYVHEFIPVDHVPQQDSGSLDCGIFVCHIMEIISSGRDVPLSIPINEIRALRAKMVHKFLNDDVRTWRGNI